eukprot:scaffold17183_cov57-Attheya_sp.AAC.1
MAQHSPKTSKRSPPRPKKTRQAQLLQTTAVLVTPPRLRPKQKCSQQHQQQVQQEEASRRIQQCWRRLGRRSTSSSDIERTKPENSAKKNPKKETKPLAITNFYPSTTKQQSLPQEWTTTLPSQDKSVGALSRRNVAVGSAAVAAVALVALTMTTTTTTTTTTTHSYHGPFSQHNDMLPNLTQGDWTTKIRMRGTKNRTKASRTFFHSKRSTNSSSWKTKRGVVPIKRIINVKHEIQQWAGSGLDRVKRNTFQRVRTNPTTTSTPATSQTSQATTTRTGTTTRILQTADRLRNVTTGILRDTMTEIFLPPPQHIKIKFLPQHWRQPNGASNHDNKKKNDDTQGARRLA